MRKFLDDGEIEKLIDEAEDIFFEQGHNGFCKHSCRIGLQLVRKKMSVNSDKKEG